MNAIHYIGFDVHKKSISFCAKTADGLIAGEGKLAAEHGVLRNWASQREQPWRGAMEATLFSGWVYDTLKPYAVQFDMAHPAMMRAIAAGKKKNDKIDARTIADMVRCDWLPVSYVAPPEVRELRRLLRYRCLVVRESVRMKNKIAGLLMETGAPYNKEKLHGRKYFSDLLQKSGRGSGVGKRPAAADARRDGDVRSHAEATGEATAGGTGIGSSRGTTGEHSRRGCNHSVDLGAGNRRSATLLLLSQRDELLRPHRGAEIVGRQRAARTDLETAQRMAADHADRSRQTGAALESATGRRARTRTGARTSQSRHTSGGAQTGGLFAGGRQEWQALRGAHNAARDGYARHTRIEEGGIELCSELTSRISVDPAMPPVDWARMPERSSESRVRYAAPKTGAPLTPVSRSSQSGVATGGSGGIHTSTCPLDHFRFASDPPAVPRCTRDCAEQALLSMRPLACFEAGRFTLTQSSWMALRCHSRKWMSGRAATLAQSCDRQQLGKSIPNTTALQGPTQKVQRDLRLSIDFYLSWMSRRSLLPDRNSASSAPALITWTHFRFLAARTCSGVMSRHARVRAPRP